MPLNRVVGLRNMVLSSPEVESRYVIASAPDVLTPALALYADCVDSNIATTLHLLDDDAGRAGVRTLRLPS